MRLERRTDVPLHVLALAPLAAIAAALVIAGVLIALAGANPITAYSKMLTGAFGSRLSIAETLTRTTPLILTGLAVAVAFRTRLWNIGAEGQLYIGALALAAFGQTAIAGQPPFIAIPSLLLVAFAAGALLLVIPVLLRIRFAVDEVVTTLLLNFVVILFVSMMLEGHLRDPMAFGWPQSQALPADLMLPKLLERSRLHAGLLIAIGAALLVWLLQARTVFGLESRAVGLNRRAAVFSGVALPRTLIAVGCISGGLAGLAGGIEVAGLKSYLTTDLSPGYGYSGIVVAMLANLHPLGVVAAAFFVAVVFVGADSMSRALEIPSFIADVIVAISLLTMLIALLFTNYRVRR